MDYHRIQQSSSVTLPMQEIEMQNKYIVAIVIVSILVVLLIIGGCVCDAYNRRNQAIQHLQKTAIPITLMVVDKQQERKTDVVYMYNPTTKTTMPQYYIKTHYKIFFENGMEYQCTKDEYNRIIVGGSYIVFVGDWIAPGSNVVEKRIAWIVFE